ncbi:hypothetical protein LZ30DRAFT_326849 [Colletotrichum cereale]|nr:hypothetical protein LZ30DRAFT_326849 [Colletotrichum cereale]
MSRKLDVGCARAATPGVRSHLPVAIGPGMMTNLISKRGPTPPRRKRDGLNSTDDWRMHHPARGCRRSAMLSYPKSWLETLGRSRMARKPLRRPMILSLGTPSPSFMGDTLTESATAHEWSPRGDDAKGPELQILHCSEKRIVEAYVTSRDPKP